MANTIVRKSYAHIQDEKAAAETITPGHLIERTSADKVQKHSTQGGAVNPLFAREDAYQGNGITDDYSTDDRVIFWHPQSGDQVYGILSSGSGDSVSIGDFVDSNGDGTLRPGSSGVEIGVALEAASAGERFTVEIL